MDQACCNITDQVRIGLLLNLNRTHTRYPRCRIVKLYKLRTHTVVALEPFVGI